MSGEEKRSCCWCRSSSGVRGWELRREGDTLRDEDRRAELLTDAVDERGDVEMVNGNGGGASGVGAFDAIVPMGIVGR